MMIVRTKFQKKIVIICDSVDAAKDLTHSIDAQLYDNEDYQNNRIVLDRDDETIRIYFYEDMVNPIPELKI